MGVVLTKAVDRAGLDHKICNLNFQVEIKDINQLQDYKEKSGYGGEDSRSSFGNINLWDVEEVMFNRQLLMWV